jgi:aminoglycoside phosphotransferase (APT) family kinase protein
MASDDSTPIRPGEELDIQTLSAYLVGKVPGAEDGVKLEQFPGGHSNLTYLLRAGRREYVLRRPPLGPVAPKAHDMAREFRLLEMVAPLFPPAPRVVHLCEDPAVVGSIFYLMERRHGVVLRQDIPPRFSSDPDFPRKASEAFIDCLAELHAVDIYKHGLDSIGRPDGFLERQVRGWAGRWQRARTTEIAAMDRLERWLKERIPESPRAALVHNDYKLDNLMFDPSDPRHITAVLDWEMASVGDPLIDVGIVMCYWPQADDPEVRKVSITPLTVEPGWLSRAEVLERYSRKSGRDLNGIAYYEVFGLFKLAVVLQQIFYRYYVGQTQDDRFKHFDRRVQALADAAELAMQGVA